MNTLPATNDTLVADLRQLIDGARQKGGSMSSEYQVNEALVARLKEELVCKTIDSLEEMGGDCLMGGDDSGLKSVWEEVCVQVQHEESCFWDTYVDMIEDYLTALVDGLPQNERLALWLSTDAGGDWIADAEADETHGASPGVYVGDIVEDLKSDLLSKAADFENSRIERYLHQQDGDDEWEDDEEEDDDDDEEDDDEETLAARVDEHLKKTGFVWQ